MYFSDTILRTFGSKSTKTIGGGKTRSNFALLIYKPVFFTARKFFLYIIFSGRIFGQVSSPKPRYIAINYLFFACIYSSLTTFFSHLVLYLFEFFEGFDVLYLSVEAELVCFRSKILFRNNVGELEFYLGPGASLASIFEFFDFFLEHAEVERESDILTLTCLLDTQYISCTTDLHISHRYLESSAEMRIVGYGDESLLGITFEFSLAIHEVTSSLSILASDTPTQLME